MNIYVYILIIALATCFTRFLPFLIFANKKQPQVIVYLSKVLPAAVMGMLVIYCLKDVSLFQSSHGIPEFLAIALVVASYIYKKNTLLSILLGTLAYMFLVQVIF